MKAWCSLAILLGQTLTEQAPPVPFYCVTFKLTVM